MQIIKSRRIVEDGWRHVAAGEAITPDEDVIVSLEVWNTERERFLERPGKLGLRVPGDTPAESLTPDLPHLSLIAIEFPRFSDGRGFSLARMLRERAAFDGELRAVGDVLRDQLAYMERCGFDAFELRSDKSLEEALGGFDELHVKYQGAADDPRPLFRRRGAQASS